jgi:predicted phosphohydrolase
MLLHPAEVAQEMEECDKLHLRTHGVERHHRALVEEVVNHIDKAAENWKPKIEEKGIHLIQGTISTTPLSLYRSVL